MALTQQFFLGASIRTWTASVGWGNATSSLNVGLVEDLRRGDRFVPPAIGEPVYFSYLHELGFEFLFGGLLKNYKQISNSSTNRSLEVVIEDPRELLEGVQLIINGYTGGIFGVPNIYNLYGYIESTGGFGASLINESGIQWWRIRDAFNVLQPTTPISFRGWNYTVDLTELPPIDVNYRISGTSISLLEYITEVCAAGMHDFFIRLEKGTVIKVKTAARNTQPTPGFITRFLTGKQATSGETGFELRNETTSKFLVGADKIDIFLQNYDAGDANLFDDDTIWPFWGFDIDKKLIIGQEKFENSHNFEVDSRAINALGLGATYKTNVEELRYALMGQDDWESFLWLENDKPGSFHFGKANKLGLVSNTNTNLHNFINGLDKNKIINLQVADLAGLDKQNLVRFERMEDRNEENNRRIFEFVRHIASEYYGRKFMVRVPFVSSKREPDTLRLVTSHEPVDAGFIEEAVWPNAVAGNLLSSDINFFTQEDGKLMCYVKYEDTDNIDLSNISPEEYSLVKDKKTVFILASVNQEIVYKDKDRLLDPRVVITLPGVVKKKVDEFKFGSFLVLIVTNRLIALGVGEAERQEIINKIAARFGSDNIIGGMEGMALIPKMAAVPMKSNIAKYGPWYATGATGRTEFEEDSNLAPWNFAGYTVMNLTAISKVVDVFSNLQVSEYGSVEIPGSPTLNLGDVLIAGGPYVTDMDVSIGTDGVTTRYRMRTWTPQFGKIPRAAAERAKNMALALRKKTREGREKDRPLPKNHQDFKDRQDFFVGRADPRSSASLLCSEVLSYDYQYRQAVVTASPYHDAIPRIANSYAKKSVMSWDGLLRPFSCVYDTESTTSSGFPHFEQPDVGAKTPNVEDLNPFKYGHDIAVISRDSTLPDWLGTGSGFQSLGDQYRGIGLRAPLILVGYGYDTNGKPVPNENPSAPTAEFHNDYLNRMDLWKAGPLDARWDQDRKVWVAGGSDGRHGVLLDSIVVNGSGRCKFYERVNGIQSGTDTIEYVFDFMLSSGQVLWTYSKVFVMKDKDGFNYVWSANCP